MHRTFCDRHHPAAFRRGRWVALVVAMAVGVELVLAATALAIPNATADPAWGTNGHVSAIVQVGNIAIVGGTFTEVAENGGSGPATLPRNNIAAFDTTTGEPLSGWAPSVDGEVAALAVSADGSKVYAAGAFT